MRALLRRTWERWKVIAHIIGNFQARVLLSIFYFLVVPPFALIVKIYRDPLHLRHSKSDSFWISRPASDTSETAAKRQF